MKNFTPMFFTTLKKYSAGQFARDVISGVIVAIIALPLSIALALASGVGPEQGLYTAIIAGFIISFLGGSTVQIAGPTAAFATIVAGIVAKNGMTGLATATIMAGVILIIMGLFRFGSLIKFIPYTITTGFTAGIAVTILVGQLKDFFGITYGAGVAPIETTEKLSAFFASISSINYQSVIIGAVCLLILIVMPYISRMIPGSIIAVAVGIIMVKVMGMDVLTIGDLYTISGSLPTLQTPDLSFASMRAMAGDAFTIAILAAIESLLSCVVADGMTGTRHRSNMELIAQGVGNIGSAIFGGIPATGAIARTATNIKSGGRTPVAGMVHAAVLLLILIVLMPYAVWIPMPAIAAILFVVAYNMCQWRPFVRLVKTAPKSDIFVLVITFVLTVLFDLVVAIEFGMIIACLLFIKRTSEETSVQGWKYTENENDPDSIGLRTIPRHVRVYEITGPLFFGAADRVAYISTKDFTRCLVLRMRGVPSIDATAMMALEELYKKCHANGITLVMSHVNDQPMAVMRKNGFAAKVGNENFCSHIDEALTRAASLAGDDKNITVQVGASQSNK